MVRRTITVTRGVGRIDLAVNVDLVDVRCRHFFVGRTGLAGVLAFCGFFRNCMSPVVAYRAVKQHQPGASLNLLWAMAAGLADKDWRELTDRDKQKLIEQLEN